MHAQKAYGICFFFYVFLIKMAFCPAGNSFVVYRNPDDEFDTQTIKLPDMKTGNIYIGKKCVFVSIID